MLSVGLYLINYLVALHLKNLKYLVTDMKNRLWLLAQEMLNCE